MFLIKPYKNRNLETKFKAKVDSLVEEDLKKKAVKEAFQEKLKREIFKEKS